MAVRLPIALRPLRPTRRRPALYGRPMAARRVSHRPPVEQHPACLPRPESRRASKPSSSAPYRSDPNLLSATSTLEMGINIGDLLHRAASSRCRPSPPTRPAAWIGRAGRRDGNALVGTNRRTAPPRPLLLRGRKAMPAAARRQPTGLLSSMHRTHPAAQLLAFTLDAGAEGIECPGLAPPAQTPPLDAVEKAGNGQDTSRTPPVYYHGAVVPGPSRASCWKRALFAKLSPDHWLTPPKELQRNHSLQGEAP